MKFCCNGWMGVVKIVGGIGCLIVGLIGVIMPEIPGLAFIAIGLSLLLGHFGWQHLRAGFKRHSKRFFRSKPAARKKVVAKATEKASVKAPMKARAKKASL